MVCFVSNVPLAQALKDAWNTFEQKALVLAQDCLCPSGKQETHSLFMRSHQTPCPARPVYWGGIWKQWQICSEDCVWGQGLFSSVWVSVFLIWKVWMISPSLSESRRIVQFKWAHGGDSTWRGALSIMNCAYCSCSSIGCRPSPACPAHNPPLWKNEENYPFYRKTFRAVMTLLRLTL